MPLGQAWQFIARGEPLVLNGRQVQMQVDGPLMPWAAAPPAEAGLVMEG